MPWPLRDGSARGARSRATSRSSRGSRRALAQARESAASWAGCRRPRRWPAPARSPRSPPSTASPHHHHHHAPSHPLLGPRPPHPPPPPRAQLRLQVPHRTTRNRVTPVRPRRIRRRAGRQQRVCGRLGDRAAKGLNLRCAVARRAALSDRSRAPLHTRTAHRPEHILSELATGPPSLDLDAADAAVVPRERAAEIAADTSVPAEGVGGTVSASGAARVTSRRHVGMPAHGGGTALAV
eukprot:7379687-Prymnesium_polylepis.4